MKKLVALVTIILSSAVFGGGTSDNTGVIPAINQVQYAINGPANATTGSQPPNLAQILVNLFSKNITGKNLPTNNSSILDKKVDFYANGFYSMYTNPTALNSSLETTSNYSLPSSDVLQLTKQTKQSVGQLLRQEIYYNMRRGVANMIKDFFSLLLLQTEGGFPNDISPSANFNGPTILARASGGSSQGSITPGYSTFNLNATTKNGTTIAPTLDILDASVLFGPDGYNTSNNDDQTARMYINQLIQSVPALKVFDFTPVASIGPASPGTVTINLPYDSSNGTAPYTAATINTTETNATVNYATMLNAIESNNTYLQYKMMVRSQLSARTLYLSTLYDAYNSRIKVQATQGQAAQSLLEAENEMATAGLKPGYYANLANQSVANFNMEMLHTLNKAIYFLNKIHKDNEKLLAMQAITGLQTMSAGSASAMSTYIQPIGSLICGSYATQCVQSGS